MQIVRQFGVRRSGTNAMKAFLRNNFAVSVHDHHKHWLPTQEELDSDVAEGYVVSVKDPYAWMDSMIRWRQTCSRNWQKWNHQYDPVGYSIQDGNYFAEDHCNIWNAYNLGWHFMSLRTSKPVLIVGAEEFMADQVAVGKRIVATFDVAIRSKITPVIGVVAPGVKETKTRFDPNYYLKKRYMDKLKALKPVINKRIDWGIAKLFNYERA